jgi:hypothetical protein
MWQNCRMSTALFMGVRSSFVEGAQASAAAFLDAINLGLSQQGLPHYTDPISPPNVYSGRLFGRSALDHHSSRVLVKIADLGVNSRESPNLALIRDNPFRLTFVPINFSPPFPSRYQEQIVGRAAQIWIGSLPRLQIELQFLATNLRIPMKGGRLSDETAFAINEFKPLYSGDSTELSEHERTAWLVLYEGTRLAMSHNAALSLAG